MRIGSYIRSCVLVHAALLLSGCATLFAPNWSVYRIPAIGKTAVDGPQFESDRKFCRTAAEGWRQEIAASGVIISAGQGAVANSASLNPIAIGVGTVAGGANSALAQSGLSIADERDQFLDCMRRLTDADKSAFVPTQR